MNSKALSFQDVIIRLQEYWAAHGCLIWQPYSEKVGAGTANPATVLRVLGPEPWNVAYAEPSYRPDDGRYAENPNRMQMHTQYQVILKPAPEDSQQLYLGSLEAIGIDLRQHDVRFVEDNWEAPALGAWGLGWEVWLDGQEITQYTYFQQAGGWALDPVPVELTYGLERIVTYLQGIKEVWRIDWDGRHSYGDILRTPEIEHCIYDFEVADVGRLHQMYDLFEAEAMNALAHKLVIPAHDYVLRCSHTFNLLDARGAIGVTERQQYFVRMRDLARQVSMAYVEQREREGHPWLKLGNGEAGAAHEAAAPAAPQGSPAAPRTFYLEIGVEELPAADVVEAIAQLEAALPKLLDGARLAHGPIKVTGTPRRLVALVEALAPVQAGQELLVKGPPAERAYDAAGKLTQAGAGFARSRGVEPEALEVRQEGSGRYVYAVVRQPGRLAAEVLGEALPGLVAGIKFGKNMRWNASNVAFSRPIRWLVALHGESPIPFQYAGVTSGSATRGPRFEGSPELALTGADAALSLLQQNRILVDRPARRAEIARQVAVAAAEAGGAVPDDPGLLDEVTDLVEYPTALLGRFEERFLALPKDVLVTVMRKHQRYFPVFSREEPARLLPFFIAVRNGTGEYLDVVRSGNEDVLRARFADASFFFKEDRERKLEEFTPRLATLTFQARLGSMLDKVHRVEALVPRVGGMLGLDAGELATAQRAAALFKSDLATHMVVELTSLQGVMGREYARLSGEPAAVAEAIFEHYLPRFQGDILPGSPAGLALGIANRLDSLVGLFAVGLAPTGSADPFGLRREALGIVQALIGKQQPMDLRPAARAAGKGLPVTVDEKALEEVLAFVRDRLYGVLRDEGLPHDAVSAVLAEQGHIPFKAYEAAHALTELVAAPDWPELLTAYARCKRIVRGLPEIYPLAPAFYQDDASRGLLEALEAAEPRLDGTINSLGQALRDLRAPINRFFTDVLVNAEDPDVRRARLALVQRIAALPDGVADLGLLQGF
jgi:glycyl-tRNA synthetase